MNPKHWLKTAAATYYLSLTISMSQELGAGSVSHETAADALPEGLPKAVGRAPRLAHSLGWPKLVVVVGRRPQFFPCGHLHKSLKCPQAMGAFPQSDSRGLHRALHETLLITRAGRDSRWEEPIQGREYQEATTTGATLEPGHRRWLQH